jgi:hypothetical protein
MSDSPKTTGFGQTYVPGTGYVNTPPNVVVNTPYGPVVKSGPDAGKGT